MNQTYSFDDLIDPDRETWLAARWRAEFDPDTRATLTAVRDAYAEAAQQARKDDHQ